MKPKVLHMGFHNGCTKDVEYVCKLNGFDFHHMRFNDGITEGNKIYNVSEEIANNAWKKYKDYYNSFDLIITSDTAPISRTLLQNNFEKPLIIWVCNRFDYFDWQTYDGTFPDEKYYEMIKNANNKNIKICPYTPFEKIYAKTKKCDDNFGKMIQPVGSKTLGMVHDSEDRGSPIPKDIIKEETFFIPPYRNDVEILKVSDILSKMNIKNCATRYGSPIELESFRGIVHIPYAWSNLALFENLNLGITYFLPSLKFWKEIDSSIKPNGLFFSNPKILQFLKYSEWYSPYNKDNFVFFDSWEHLRYLSENYNVEEFIERKKTITLKSKERNNKNLNKWKDIFEEFNLL